MSGNLVSDFVGERVLEIKNCRERENHGRRGREREKRERERGREREKKKELIGFDSVVMI